MTFKLALNHEEYRMVLKALLLLPGKEGMDLVLHLRKTVLDPADDGPEVAILSVEL